MSSFNQYIVRYILHLADDALILGHRNSEWTGHGPILEQDIALSNIALDLIGQSRNFYQLAASRLGDGKTEDDLAYLRGPNEFLNHLLSEQENGHWGTTILRQFFSSQHKSLLYQHLQKGNDSELAAIAEKSLKEVTYHLRWSGEWVIRLGLGTEESNSKMQDSLNHLWPYTAELYTPVEYEKTFIGDAGGFSEEWMNKTQSLLERARLVIPAGTKMLYGGKTGSHTPHLTRLLDEMQHLQRTYPGMEW